jgi:hypothetical protein
MVGQHTLGPHAGAQGDRPRATSIALADRTREAAALLQPEDLAGAQTVALPPSRWGHLRPPRPGPDTFRSDVLRRTDRAIAATYTVADRPTRVLEHVSTYRRSGAADYLAELRNALSGYHGCVEPTRRWMAVDEDLLGDESVMLRLREDRHGSAGHPGRLWTSYLLVARVGAGIIVLGDLGWAGGDGHEAVVRHLAPAAVCRAGRL